MNTRPWALYVAVTFMLGTGGASADSLKGVEFTAEFPDPADCAALATDTPAAQNRYFPLEVNRTWTLSNASCVADGDCDELEENVITVLPTTEVVDGLTTRVVQESESINGVQTEISRNFFAECVGTGDVYYFGEQVDIYNPDGSITHEGAWQAGGENRAGLIMPGGAFLLGARYFQEWAPDIALDRAEHTEMGLSFDNPADGQFEDCVLVVDTNALEDSKGKEGDEKMYCPGIGIVKDEEMELTSCVTGLGTACSQ